MDENEEEIRLFDFGESFAQHEGPQLSPLRCNLLSPEVIFTERYDHNIDLWRAGNVVSSPPSAHRFCLSSQQLREKGALDPLAVIPRSSNRLLRGRRDGDHTND